MTKLNKYAATIKDVIKISKNSNMIPHIEHQSFKYISVSFDHKMLFHISTSSTDLSNREALDYSNELKNAADICKQLNKCYLEDRDDHIISQLKHI